MTGAGNYCTRSKIIRKDKSVIEIIESVNISYIQYSIQGKLTAVSPAALNQTNNTVNSDTIDVSSVGSGISSSCSTLLEAVYR